MKKKILFTAQNFYIGGVQTSLINLLKFLSEEQEYDIDLFTFAKGELLSQIPDSVNVFYADKVLGLASTPFMNVLAKKNPVNILLRVFLIIFTKLVGSDRFYRWALSRQQKFSGYDVAVSYFDDVPGCLFNKGANLFVSDFVKCKERVAWVHNDPIKSGYSREHCYRIYKNFDKIICVSQAVKENLIKMLPEYEDKMSVCYNRVPKNEIEKAAQEYVPFNSDKFNIVTVCRIDNKQKRINEIVRLCRRLKDENINNFTWRIVGDGPDLKENISLSQELGVSDVLEFSGQKVNPYPYIKHSDLFALYSAYEGYPMVVEEARVFNKFIITTNYAAAKEQISPDCGVVCDSDDAFFEALKDILKQER